MIRYNTLKAKKEKHFTSIRIIPTKNLLTPRKQAKQRKEKKRKEKQAKQGKYKARQTKYPQNKKAPASSDTGASLSKKTATTYSPTVTQYHRRD